MAEATVFWVSMRIHQPDFVTLATLVFLVTVVVVVDWASAGEAPTIPNAPRRAIAITKLIHCLRVFISVGWFVCVSPILRRLPRSSSRATRIERYQGLRRHRNRNRWAVHWANDG